MSISLDEFYRQKELTDKGVEAKLEALSEIGQIEHILLEDPNKPLSKADLLQLYEIAYMTIINRE